MNFASLRDFFAGSTKRGYPYASERDYGATLDAAVVKWAGEQTTAAQLFGLPRSRVHIIPNGVVCPDEPIAHRTPPSNQVCELHLLVFLSL